MIVLPGFVPQADALHQDDPQGLLAGAIEGPVCERVVCSALLSPGPPADEALATAVDAIRLFCQEGKASPKLLSVNGCVLV